ncbi:hypothetical protein [Desulfovibrio sp. QI0434]
MEKQNLFWPIYKNIERETLAIADYIHFSDDQSKVYSIRIADLIIRCAVEIESISKFLYTSNGGNQNVIDSNGNRRELYFDTDCIDFLNNLWKLSVKEIQICAKNFYFTKESNLTLTPLHKANKRGDSGSSWKKAYQSIKHNRVKCIREATIKNLLNALGALLILNTSMINRSINMVKRALDSAQGTLT